MDEYKESEISKIVKRLMDEEGFEFGEAVREAMEQTKNFESKADGGSIGIEVLFKPKRQNFFMGGPALEGQALSIYNSMNAYGFSDQEIANALTERGLYTPPGSDSGTPPGAGDNIIGSQINQGGGGGGGGITELQKTFTTENVSPTGGVMKQELLTLDQKKANKALSTISNPEDYPYSGPVQKFSKIGPNIYDVNPEGTITGQRTYKTPRTIGDQVYAASQSGGLGTITNTEPGLLNKGITAVQDFFSGLGSKKVQGTLGDRLLKQSQSMTIPSLASAFGKLRSPFNPDSPTYNPNLPAQLNFLEMGTIGDKSGLNLIGRDPGTGGLKYGSDSVLAGKNVISGFGTNDYEKALMDYITKMATNKRISDKGRDARLKQAKEELAALTGQNADDISVDQITTQMKIADTNKISASEAAGIMAAIQQQNEPSAPGRGDAGNPGGSSGAMTDDNVGTYCFDPNTLVQMADGSEKKIKEIQLGDQTKGGEVTGVFQFKASDEIHDYKGVTVAGSHYVKEDGKFIMVKDSPLSVKIDKIPVVYSLDTTGRRIFINDIEFADYNGDGVAKNFLTNAGVDLTGFDTEVLRQVEHRLI